MNRARSTSPGLMLLPHPIADQVHGPMQGGRNNDDGEEAEERVAGEESRDGPRGDREGQEERAEDEIVLVEPGRLRAAGQMHPPLDEGAREVSEERSEGEDRRGPEGFGDRRSEGPARRGSEDEKRCGEEEPQEGAAGGPADEASPGLAVAEQALAIAQGPSEVDRPATAEEDGRRIRDEGGEEEPQGLGDRLEGHRAVEGAGAGYR